jgi:hypothetical protein
MFVEIILFILTCGYNSAECPLHLPRTHCDSWCLQVTSVEELFKWRQSCQDMEDYFLDHYAMLETMAKK